MKINKGLREDIEDGDSPDGRDEARSERIIREAK